MTSIYQPPFEILCEAFHPQTRALRKGQDMG